MAISGSALKSTIGPDRLDMTSPASRADLAIGMQLLRASNMKAVRLQLALVRRDSGLAIEAIDGLIDLDAEIAGFIADMPPATVSIDELGEISRWIDEQKRAIASEKLILVCGSEGPGMRSNYRSSISPANSDETDEADDPESSDDDNDDNDDVMDLSGAELGSKRVVADIEAGAWEIEPSAPGTDGKLQARPADFKNLAAIEANARELQFTVADIDERLKRIPGKSFMLMTVLTIQAVLGLLVIFGDAIKPLVPLALQSLERGSL